MVMIYHGNTVVNVVAVSGWTVEFWGTSEKVAEVKQFSECVKFADKMEDFTQV